MSAWPKDDAPVGDFEQLTNPLVQAVRFCYSLARKNEDKDIPYKGFDGCYRRASDQFAAENLRYSDEDQGRDALTEIIGYAVQVGIEQGRRIELEKRNHATKRLILSGILLSKGISQEEIDQLSKIIFD